MNTHEIPYYFRIEMDSEDGNVEANVPTKEMQINKYFPFTDRDIILPEHEDSDDD